MKIQKMVNKHHTSKVTLNIVLLFLTGGLVLTTISVTGYQPLKGLYYYQEGIVLDLGPLMPGPRRGMVGIRDNNWLGINMSINGQTRWLLPVEDVDPYFGSPTLDQKFMNFFSSGQKIIFSGTLIENEYYLDFIKLTFFRAFDNPTIFDYTLIPSVISFLVVILISTIRIELVKEV